MSYIGCLVASAIVVCVFAYGFFLSVVGKFIMKFDQIRERFS